MFIVKNTVVVNEVNKGIKYWNDKNINIECWTLLKVISNTGAKINVLPVDFYLINSISRL